MELTEPVVEVLAEEETGCWFGDEAILKLSRLDVVFSMEDMAVMASTLTLTT